MKNVLTLGQVINSQDLSLYFGLKSHFYIGDGPAPTLSATLSEARSQKSE